MPEHLILVDRDIHAAMLGGDYPVTTASDYLVGSTWQRKRRVRIVNLCRTRRYLGEGYYCSMLAEARGHRVIPTVRTIRDLCSKSLYTLDTHDLDSRVKRIFNTRLNISDKESFSIVVMFGYTSLKELQPLSREIFELFRMPLIKVSFTNRAGWRIRELKPLGLQELSVDMLADFNQGLERFLSKRWRDPQKRHKAKYDLAILHDPMEEMPPSNAKALQLFMQSATRHGFDPELITHKDFGRLGEFDALFIRATTAIDHYTYRFARKASSEGLVVMDDPDSILRCTNKIYLYELLRANSIATPKTAVVSARGLDRLAEEISYPIVLKTPDGSFSRGIHKVDNRQELLSVAKQMLRSSELLLGQAYIYTPFDWRIGIINRKPLYACKYFMSPNHWQIYHHGEQTIEGEHNTLQIEEVPAVVIETAVKAANLIGDGFYGVDLKETQQGVLVIEINDNPSIESGVEDEQLGYKLYDRIMEQFLVRIESIKGHLPGRNQAAPSDELQQVSNSHIGES